MAGYHQGGEVLASAQAQEHYRVQGMLYQGAYSMGNFYALYGQTVEPMTH